MRTRRQRNPTFFTLFAMVMVATLILASITGCSEDGEQTPTAPPNGQDELADRLERIEEALAEMQAEMDRETATSGPGPQERTPQPGASTPASSPTAAAPTRTTEPAPAPTPTPPPTFTVQGPGICRRSPEVQEAILERLGTSLCQATTIPELFRITGEFRVEMNTVRTGDFQGMVNVERLEVRTNGVEPAGFAGLHNLEELELRLLASTDITTESLAGLESLESLTLEISSPDREDPMATALPPFPSMPNLKSLRAIGIHNPENDQLPGTLLKELPAMESVEMSVYYIGTVNDWGGNFRLPGDLFQGNPNLKVVSYSKQSGPEEMTLQVPATLFAQNRLIEKISIRDSLTRIPKDMFNHLENLEELYLEARYTDGGWENHEITLSNLSPLYNKITYGNEHPSGYVLEGMDN